MIPVKGPSEASGRELMEEEFQKIKIIEDQGREEFAAKEIEMRVELEKITPIEERTMQEEIVKPKNVKKIAHAEVDEWGDPIKPVAKAHVATEVAPKNLPEHLRQIPQHHQASVKPPVHHAQPFVR